MSISENVSFDLVLNDSKIRIKTALDKIVSRIQVNYTNQVIAKTKYKTYQGVFGDSYTGGYWAIVERVPVRLLNFTLWHKDRIIMLTQDIVTYDGACMFWDIYDRKIVETAIDEINKFSVHYPRSIVNITKHFRPTSTEPGHLIASDELL